ncbi:MAG: hypothetical protein AB1327_11575 [Bacillota bacterium]
MCRKFWQDQRGSVLTVEFLLIAVLVLVLAFGGLDYWLVQAEMQQAEHLKNYYLDRMRVEGYLSSADEADMLDRFADAGFTVTGIEGPRESQGDPRVLRNVLDPTTSEVYLRVEAAPEVKPFLMGRLLGQGSSDFTIRVAGRALSERVDP